MGLQMILTEYATPRSYRLFMIILL